MIEFTIYDTQGKIRSSGRGSRELIDLEAMMEPGDKAIGTFADPRRQYIANDQIVPFPPKPSEFSEFDWTTKQWRSDSKEAATHLRMKRSQLISVTDWTQLPDVSEQIKLKWQPYRQALRDITLQPGFPFEVDWPKPPQ